jgi:hypothetical protein
VVGKGGSKVTRMKRTLDIEKIQKLQRAFAKARDWDQFHNPKNLSMALASEAGELLELFQWLEASASSSIMTNTSSQNGMVSPCLDDASPLRSCFDHFNCN